jgi:hypothetical protein
MKSYFGQKLIIALIWSLTWSSFDILSQVSEELFITPPAKTRILKIVHSLPDRPEAQESLFSKLTNQGFGGVVCNVAFENYLQSQEKWDAFVRGVKRAKDMGLSLWLYDERGYPSGNAGGLVLKDKPEWAARGLLILSTNVHGSKNIKLNIPDGDIILAEAYPKSNGICLIKSGIDLRKYTRNGQLECDIPEGNWQVLVISENQLFEGTHAAMNLWEKIPYINLLKPEPTKRFIELTHAEYAKRLGGDLNNYFEATFTDEPSLMSLFLKPMPWKVLPWSDNLPVEFKKRRGYDIRDHFSSLILETNENWKKHRYDFWLTVGELVSQNYFGQIRDWCRQQNLLSGGHLLAEEGIVNHVSLYGDFYRCIRMLDAPGIDCLTSIPREVPWFIARLVSSCGWIEGKNVIMSETSDHSQVYRPPGDDRPKRFVTEDEIRGTLNLLFVNGVTRITSYYSFNQLTDEQLKRLNQQCGRCALMIEKSKPFPNIGVLYPVQTLWTKFVPSDLWSREATGAAKVEKIYRTVINSLFNNNMEFLIIDYDTIENCSVGHGKLQTKNIKLDTIILPNIDTISWKAIQNIDTFVKSGGLLIIVGAFPENSEVEFPSKKIINLVENWFEPKSKKPVLKKSGNGIVCYLPTGFEFALGEILQTVCPQDLLIEDPNSQIKVSRRMIGDETLFFVINDSNQKWTGNLVFSNYVDGEEWSPINGVVVKNLASTLTRYTLDPYSMVFFKFKKVKAADKEISSFTNSVELDLSSVRIDCSSPRIARGEFVSATMSETTAEQDKTSHLYQCSGTLTKSEVDTWLFLIFPVNSTESLDNKTTLSFKVFIPQDQDIKGQLLVIVKEKNGGDFIAETGVYLSEVGEMIVRVPLANMQLAGWSKDEDGMLNPKAIEEIRIGWGGYLGKAGERIVFKTSPPVAEKIILRKD